MISTAYILIVAGLSVMVAFFDVLLFQISYFQAVKNMFWNEIISPGYVLLITFIIGMILCLFLDIRLYRNKERKSP